MRTIYWLFVYGVFVATASNITIPATSQPEIENSPNTADLTLETVLGFNSTENADNIFFLDKVQKVIGNIKSVFERKSNSRRAFNSEKVEKFTDFIQKLIKKLNDYDDTDLKYFITVFNDEIRKYHYRGCKFHELIQNYSLRRYLSSMLNDLQVQSPEIIREKLKKFGNKLEKEKYNRHEENLVEIINSVYRKDSIKKFQYFLIDLDTYRLKSGKLNINLVEVIKEGLRLIIFDHYSQLNQNARRELKFQVNKFWKYLSQNIPIVTTNSVKSSKTQNTTIQFNTIYSVLTMLKQSNNVSINRDTKIDKKQSMHPSNSTARRLNKNENRTKVKNELTSKVTLVTSKGKLKRSKNYKQNGRQRAQIITTRRLLTKTKNLTFKTLYPELVPEWTKAHSLVGEAQFARRSNSHWHKVKDAKHKPSGAKDKHLDEKLSTTAKIRSRSSNVSRKTAKFNKYKKEVPAKRRGINRRKANRRVMYHKATRQKHSKKYNRTKISYKRMVDLSSDSGDTRDSIDSIVSDEGLSIEGFKEVQTNISQRRTDTNFNGTLHSPATELQAKVTESLPDTVNTIINNNSKINIEAKNETSNNKDKLRVDNLEKVQKDTLKKGNEKLDNLKASSSTWEVNKPTTYISDVDRLNVTERSYVNKNTDSFTYSQNNKELSSVSTQTTRDEGALFNFRAMGYSNETEIVTEFAKNKHDNLKNDVILRNNPNVIQMKKDLDETQAGQNTLLKKQDESQPGKTMDKPNLKTDNDFKSFILDYENDINEFKKSEATKKNYETSSLVTEVNTKTETTTSTTPIWAKTTTAPVTENPIHKLSTIANVNPRKTLNNNTSSYNINQNRYLQANISKPYAFDAKLIKELMRTTKKPTTTRISTIMGRQLNKDGIIFDSMEEVKQELYDTALNNVEYDYEKGKGSDYENKK